MSSFIIEEMTVIIKITKEKKRKSKIKSLAGIIARNQNEQESNAKILLEKIKEEITKENEHGIKNLLLLMNAIIIRIKKGKHSQESAFLKILNLKIVYICQNLMQKKKYDEMLAIFISHWNEKSIFSYHTILRIRKGLSGSNDATLETDLLNYITEMKDIDDDIASTLTDLEDSTEYLYVASMLILIGELSNVLAKTFGLISGQGKSPMPNLKPPNKDDKKLKYPAKDENLFKDKILQTYSAEVVIYGNFRKHLIKSVNVRNILCHEGKGFDLVSIKTNMEKFLLFLNREDQIGKLQIIENAISMKCTEQGIEMPSLRTYEIMIPHLLHFWAKGKEYFNFKKNVSH